MKAMQLSSKYLVSGAVVLIAIGVAALKYWDYLSNPWTRNGQVRANVIQVATRVSGPIVELPIRDNQFVRAGDLLFEIDPRTYRAALDQAMAQLDETRDNLAALEKQVEAAEAVVEQSRSSISEAQSAVKAAEAQLEDATKTFERNKRLVDEGTISRQAFDDRRADYLVAVANKDEADAALLRAESASLQAEANLAQVQATLGAPGEENAQLRAARAAVEEAQLNLEFTEVKASVDGYVTNLQLRLGSQAVANQPALALVDSDSYWVDAYFRETETGRFKNGDRAVVTLMSYPDLPIEGRVDSISWGIAKQDGSTGFNLLPSVSPTFEWIRLAQRVPVRIHLDAIPDGVDLRVGTTASVLVRTGTAGSDDTKPATAAPSVLQ
jgi:multidrug resistance efflux pump